MNGESVFGWLKVAVAFIALAILGFLAYKIAEFIKKSGGLGNAILDGSQWLKENTPLGLPARGIDAAIKSVSGGAAKGGEDTVGGLFARIREKISGDDAKIRAMLKVEPKMKNGVTYTNSIFVGDLPMGDIALPNPRDAR